MRPFVIVAAAVALIDTAAAPANAAQQTQAVTAQIHTDQDISAAKRKKRVRGHQAYGSGQQIACTQLGCNPIPRGCRVVPGRIPFTWDPSGFDEVQCPYYR
jgi:hypothetical protein